MAQENPHLEFRPSRRSVLRASALAVPAVLMGRTALGDAVAAPAPRAGGSSVFTADPLATGSAIDLADLLDTWAFQGSMAVGQQLNVNGDDPFGPVTALGEDLGSRLRVLGWTTNEWDYAVRHHYNEEVLDNLITVAKASTPTVLVTSWYPHNPRTGQEAHARPGPKVVDRVLKKGTPERKAFLAEFDERVAPYLLQLQDNNVATIFRPLIEANSFWFWWGCDNGQGGSREWKSGIRRLFRLVQKRAWSHGIHNVLWGFSFVPADNYRAANPVSILPLDAAGGPAYDIAGLSSYDFEKHADDKDVLELGSYAAVANYAPRMALGEVGPANSNGNWDPHIITSTLQAHASDVNWQAPIYGMFWFDDGEPDPTNTDGSWIAGKKQLSSLTGGPSWLATSSTDGLIDVVP
jgi:hypothetical protein